MKERSVGDLSSSVRSESLALVHPIPLSEHPAAVYLEGLSLGSQRTMRWALDSIASLLTQGECDHLTLDWGQLRYRHCSLVRNVLKNRYAPVTANKMLAALRRTLQEAYRLDWMEATDYNKAIDFPNLPIQGQKLRGRALAGSEIDALLGICEQDVSAKGIRDTAIIAVLRGTGMRRGELVALEVRDYDRKTGKFTIRQGKGGKFREVYLAQEAKPWLKEWLSLRLSVSKTGPLFCRIRRGGHLHPQAHMSGGSIFRILEERREQVEEMEMEHFSPHDLRRTLCSELLEVEDISTVQQIAGHSTPATTVKYDRRGEKAKKRAANRVGFRKPKTS
ncbi:UNVERIFIED_CONTAM: hypothetical protein BEN50_11645 [Euhalothece sp. KZN 001]